MAVIEVTELGYSHPGGEPLFDDVSFRVGSGRHAGLVGANGVGKTTLLRVLVGELQPETGTARTDGSMLLMPQRIEADTVGPTVRDLFAAFTTPHVQTVATGLLAAERALEARPGDEAAGMRYAEMIADWTELGGYELESRWDACTSRVLRQPLDVAGSRSVDELSGGERKRLVLESVFDSDVEILLLDEPDNFLDLDGKAWLEEVVRASRKTILFISHDRALLEAAAGEIVTIEAYGSWTHPGSFADYDEARARRNTDLAGALRRWEQEERRLFQQYKLWKQRAAYSDGLAGRAAAAEARWQRFVDKGPPPAPPPPRRVGIDLAGGRSGQRVLRCDGLELDGLTEPFDVEVFYRERVAVLGPNGSGKSHFLRLLGGDPTVDHTGSFQLGARVHVGLFHQLADLQGLAGQTPLDVLAGKDLAEEPARRALARYELGDCARREVATMSGGERARLQILLLELSGTNLLLLDEPTDNLDLLSVEALERSLETFDGTILCVTHDRWFMRSFTRYLVFDHDCSLREVLDLDSALALLVEAGPYTLTRASVLDLSVRRGNEPFAPS